MPPHSPIERWGGWVWSNLSPLAWLRVGVDTRASLEQEWREFLWHASSPSPCPSSFFSHFLPCYSCFVSSTTVRSWLSTCRLWPSHPHSLTSLHRAPCEGWRWQTLSAFVYVTHLGPLIELGAWGSVGPGSFVLHTVYWRHVATQRFSPRFVLSADRGRPLRRPKREAICP